MSANQEDILVQKITIIRDNKPFEPLDRSFLKELTYVETSDLSGPRLMFVIDDYYRIIRDELGVKPKDVLEVVLSDRFQRDGLDKIIRFVILTMPINDRWITFNCIEASVYKLKLPAREAIVFSHKSVSAVLQKLAPGLKYDVGSFPATNDYHLLPAMRPSKMLRQMAQEHGAVCFWQRGQIVFRKLKELYSAAPEMVYSHNDSRKGNKVIVYSRPNTEGIIQDLTERNYVGWDMVEGFQKSSRVPKAPAEFTSASKASLDNLTEIPKPVIDFSTAGNGALLPGLTLGLEWNTERADMPIDESLPAKVVIGMVAHSWSPQSYFCQVSGIRN